MNQEWNQEWFSIRLAKLREQRKLSAREFSLAIGQSPGYINKIENQKCMPSMEVFFYICRFLEITPEEFFKRDVEHPLQVKEAMDEVEIMDTELLDHVIAISRGLNSAKAAKTKK